MNLDELVERVKGHTPGPWLVFDKPKILSVMKAGGTAEVVHWHGFDSSSFPKANRANARLIAAAPSLLTLAVEQAEKLENYEKGMAAECTGVSAGLRSDTNTETGAGAELDATLAELTTLREAQKELRHEQAVLAELRDQLRESNKLKDAALETFDALRAELEQVRGACDCSVSTGICGQLTRGKGNLDHNGYWERPCPHGRAFEDYKPDPVPAPPSPSKEGR